MSAPTSTVDPLVARGAALGLLARLLGEDVEPLASGAGVDELRGVLETLGDAAAISELEHLTPSDQRSLAALRVRLFDHGRASPHETSYIPVGAGGHTGVLADVAGFYRALGMKASGERPDHVVAELEFASLATLAEAHHRSEGRDEVAGVCADLACTFLREHLGCWLDRFAAKLVATDPEGPYGPVARAAAAVVASECRQRGVDPIQIANLFITPSGPGLGDPMEDELPNCGEGLA